MSDFPMVPPGEVALRAEQAAAAWAVTGPGLYDGLDEAAYHADRSLGPELGRSLSVSGAKLLLDSPARFHYEREHRPPPKDAYDFGHVAHRLILGEGGQVRRINAPDWRTAAAKAEKAQAYAAGQVPILRHDFVAALRLAKAVKRHPVAGKFFTEGRAEQSLFWVDERTGVTCRARVDWLRHNVIVDLKSCQDASRSGMQRAFANYRYAMQAQWYRAGVEAVTGKRLPFVFVCVEKDPPHLVGLYWLDDQWEAIADQQNRRALDLYASCESAGEWPGYSDEIQTLSPPAWLIYQEQELS